METLISAGKKVDNLYKENIKMITSYHLSDSYYNDIKEMYDEEINGDSSKYLSYKIRFMNRNKGSLFYVLGLIENKAVMCCDIQQHDDDNSYFLISDFQVCKEYQNNGFGTSLIEYVVTILKEKNASRVCMFCSSKESEKIAIKLGFVKDETVKNFGYTIPGDNNDIYYELKLPTNFYLTKLTKDDAWVIGKMMMIHLNEYKENNIPKVLLPSITMWRDHILAVEELESQKSYVIKCGKIVIGYTSMYYEDYDDGIESDHSLYFWVWLDKDYLYDEIIKIVVKKVLDYYDNVKKEHHIKEIIIRKENIILSQYEFIKKNLEKNGFYLKNEMFIKK